MLNKPPVGKQISESPELRWSIFATLLLLSVAVAAIVVWYHPIITFLTTIGGGLAYHLLLIVTPFITLCPLHYHRHRHPFNYRVLLGIFTVSLAFTVGVSCALTSGNHVTYGYFYLFESLIENDDCTFWISKDEQYFKYVSLQALPDMLNHSYGGPIDFYRGGDRDQCIVSKDPSSFLGLLVSLPLHNVKDNHESFAGTQSRQIPSQFVYSKFGLKLHR